MGHPLLDVERIEQEPEAYLNASGCLFVVFDERTQDSGNVSYGVRIGADRYFVKTAGRPSDSKPYFTHSERVSALRNAVRLGGSCDHRTLPRLHQVIESPSGPMLVYEWVDGELIRSARQRFRNLPAPEITRVLDLVYEVHDRLALSGWIAVDFYDGCMIYDFERRELRLVDLDHYRSAPSTNNMGRMFGSRRFMAREEFEYGAPIDQRTTVFTMGRTAAVLLSDTSLDRRPFRGSDAVYGVMCRACRDERSERYGSVAEFYGAWTDAPADEYPPSTTTCQTCDT